VLTGTVQNDIIKEYIFPAALTYFHRSRRCG